MVVPLTEETIWRDCAGATLTIEGLTDTEIGVVGLVGAVSVTVAVANLLESATEVARTVTVCVDEIDAGAVYSPVEESVPSKELSDHVTAVLLEPVTVAANCAVWLTDTLAAGGFTEIETTAAVGVSEIVAVADLVESATEVAFTVAV